MSSFILAIDQGTTSSRAILFDRQGQIAAVAQQEFPQHFPQDGWIEHDPEDIWESVIATCREVLSKAQITPEQVDGVGITNQRETTVVWDRATGKPLYNAIVWQDRRTSERCQALRDEGYTELVQSKTGLLIDPYFSATKLAWILDCVEGARERAARGELAFGTVDSFLMWRLTDGKRHVTDATNASRTALFNIHDQTWDEELLALFDVPANMLPEVNDSSDDFGTVEAHWLGAPLPIAGVAGDQQAALVGQACFKPGMGKSTYGTGCFMIVNTGETASVSRNRLLTTIGYRINGKPTYAMEGSIFVARWFEPVCRCLGNRSAGPENPQRPQRLFGASLYRARRAPLGPQSPWRDFWLNPRYRHCRNRCGGATGCVLPNSRSAALHER